MKKSRIVSWKLIVLTIFVILAFAGLVRLGFWQLDRHESRKAFNAHLLTQQVAPLLNLNVQIPDTSLIEMEYRQVHVSGQYDHSQEIILRNQVLDNHPGVHLITPLQIAGTDSAVMVDRGWIPINMQAKENWELYIEPGDVEIIGLIRLSQEEPDIGSRSDPTPAPGESLSEWFLVNLDQIQKQVSHEILPIYIQQSPQPNRLELPTRSVEDIEITDGPHLGYAFQWFIFATILGIGYPLMVYREIKSSS